MPFRHVYLKIIVYLQSKYEIKVVFVSHKSLFAALPITIMPNPRDYRQT